MELWSVVSLCFAYSGFPVYNKQTVHPSQKINTYVFIKTESNCIDHARETDAILDALRVMEFGLAHRSTRPKISTFTVLSYPLGQSIVPAKTPFDNVSK